MIGLHAGFTILMGEYSARLHQAYTIFYVIGTCGAMQFPTVGWQPLQSMEQMMPLLVFCTLQVLGFLYYWKEKYKMAEKEFVELQVKVMMNFGMLAIFFLSYLWQLGWLGPLSNRIKSLFIPHTRTGNPLVDSVSEHQATGAHYYWQYFHYLFYVGPMGFYMLFYPKVDNFRLFGILYTLCTYYFSNKMVRLLLLLAPAASMCAGIFLSVVFRWIYEVLVDWRTYAVPPSPSPSSSPSSTLPLTSQPPVRSNHQQEPRAVGGEEDEVYLRLRPFFPLLAILVLTVLLLAAPIFFRHCDRLAVQLSNPQILVPGKDKDGKPTIFDDFMQSYWWLRDHTPPDARVMAWWDYGYQINGVANRTTIADGNTWNHEHIALLGKALVSPEKQAWRIARHLADYVLIWTTRFAGINGDDLAKMPHIGNIAGSVYPEIPRSGYVMDENGNPSELMRQSILYKLSVHGLVEPSPNLTYYKEAYTSPNKMVRIYKILNVAPLHPHGSYPPQIRVGQFRG
eukprot:TRINITY_DN1344_c0_g1_i4.p1 TRINITY_DN1344_c0_g1~~TRINITY_DN1344_c0_g1_i4.p1  ORF type:complete len:509 (+),score=89.55 TRINITY_DN1344_c0_g1_i4:101-1627(+)